MYGRMDSGAETRVCMVESNVRRKGRKEKIKALHVQCVLCFAPEILSSVHSYYLLWLQFDLNPPNTNINMMQTKQSRFLKGSRATKAQISFTVIPVIRNKS